MDPFDYTHIHAYFHNMASTVPSCAVGYVKEKRRLW